MNVTRLSDVTAALPPPAHPIASLNLGSSPDGSTSLRSTSIVTGTSISVVAASSRASGGAAIASGSTRTVTSPVAMCPLPSVIEYEKRSITGSSLGTSSSCTCALTNGAKQINTRRIEQVRKRGLPPLLLGLDERGQAPLPDLFIPSELFISSDLFIPTKFLFSLAI